MRRLSASLSALAAMVVASRAALAQPVPAPQPPMSTSGTSEAPATPLMPQGTPAPQPMQLCANESCSAQVPAPMVHDAQHDLAVDNRFRMLEARLNKDEQIEKEQAESIAWLRKFKLTGFVQPQFLFQTFSDAASPNALSDGTLPPGVSANDIIARPDGTTTNGTFFRLRRARLKTEFMPSDYARFVLEIDAAPLAGPGGPGTPTTIARQIEAVGIAKWTEGFTTEYALGIFKLPFGYEVQESDADRLFIEHSWAEQNMFPGEYDTGARATAIVRKRLVTQLALVNGVTQGERSFALIPDLNHGKDGVGRMTYDFGAFMPGFSAYWGQGQNLDAANLRFKQFQRWALGVELSAHHVFFTGLGETRFVGEIVRGQNMDRGVFRSYALPKIPIPVGLDVDDKDELGAYARVEQDLTKWLTLGARYDYYSPDLAQSSDGRHTIAIAGGVHLTTGLRLAIEYDHAVDYVHVPLTPARPSQRLDAISTVLQARF